MLKRKDYEDLYCPQNLDADNPYNYIRKNPILPLGEGLKPWYPSDSDFITLIPALLLVDKELDSYSVGTYSRLRILENYKHNWKEIYKYGAKESIDKAIDRLKQTGYIKEVDGEIKTIFA